MAQNLDLPPTLDDPGEGGGLPKNYYVNYGIVAGANVNTAVPQYAHNLAAAGDSLSTLVSYAGEDPHYPVQSILSGLHGYLQTGLYGNSGNPYQNTTGTPQTIGQNLSNLGTLSPDEYITTCSWVYDNPDMLYPAGVTPPGHNNCDATLNDTLFLSGGSLDIYIIHISGDLLITSNAVLVLGNVNPANVFWDVTGDITIQPGANFSGVNYTKGNIYLQGAVLGRLGLYAQSNVNLGDASNDYWAPNEMLTMQPYLTSLPPNLGEAGNFGVLAIGNLNNPGQLRGGTIAGFSTVSNGTATSGDISNASGDLLNNTLANFYYFNERALSFTGAIKPGLYTSLDSVTTLNSNITLSGTDSSWYLFNIRGNLVIGSNAFVTLGNVKPDHIIWNVSGNVTVTDGALFNGIINAKGNISAGRLSGGLASVLSQGNVDITNAKGTAPFFAAVAMPGFEEARQSFPDLGVLNDYALFAGDSIKTAGADFTILGKAAAMGASRHILPDSAVFDGVSDSHYTEAKEAFGPIQPYSATRKDIYNPLIPNDTIRGLTINPGYTYLGENVVLLDSVKFTGNSTDLYVINVGSTLKVMPTTRFNLANAMPQRIAWLVRGDLETDYNFLSGLVIAAGHLKSTKATGLVNYFAAGNVILADQASRIGNPNLLFVSDACNLLLAANYRPYFDLPTGTTDFCQVTNSGWNVSPATLGYKKFDCISNWYYWNADFTKYQIFMANNNYGWPNTIGLTGAFSPGDPKLTPKHKFLEYTVRLEKGTSYEFGFEYAWKMPKTPDYAFSSLLFEVLQNDIVIYSQENIGKSGFNENSGDRLPIFIPWEKPWESMSVPNGTLIDFTNPVLLRISLKVGGSGYPTCTTGACNFNNRFTKAYFKKTKFHLPPYTPDQIEVCKDVPGYNTSGNLNSSGKVNYEVTANYLNLPQTYVLYEKDPATGTFTNTIDPLTNYPDQFLIPKPNVTTEYYLGLKNDIYDDGACSDIICTQSCPK